MPSSYAPSRNAANNNLKLTTIPEEKGETADFGYLKVMNDNDQKQKQQLNSQATNKIDQNLFATFGNTKSNKGYGVGRANDYRNDETDALMVNISSNREDTMIGFGADASIFENEKGIGNDDTYDDLVVKDNN